MASLEFLAVIISILGLSASITYYAMVLKNQNKTRKAQLFMSVYQSMNSSEGLDSDFNMQNVELQTFDDLKELAKDKEKYKAYSWYANYFEGIGVLVKEDLVDINHVAKLVSGGIIWFWEAFGDLTIEARKEYDWPRYNIEVEYLYNRIIEYGKSHPELQIASPGGIHP